MSYEASYMRNNFTEEAWLFLNHLSTLIGVNTIEEIASIGESKNISYKDLTQTLIKIKAGKIDGKWIVYPIRIPTCTRGIAWLTRLKKLSNFFYLLASSNISELSILNGGFQFFISEIIVTN